ncbi:glycoside hydrolase [Setomelanomma holmii]|uniref:Glycoside hydrolase n=1 Tax=Setomelanomma holmii TaxID=210430 RepID=A0A9P4H410_9PLEO|nr:glycoside hydrolase [Setomelanomma holmii]
MTLILHSPIVSLFFDSTAAYSVKTLRATNTGRERASINDGWRFARFTSNPDWLSYDLLKTWILPTANEFLDVPKYERPSQTAPGANVSYVQAGFDDATWEKVTLPHDWAITGTFDAPGVDGGLGRLPINGVGWYPSGKSILLDIDGAMAYAAVWLNGELVGGWPFGYNSFRLDLTSFAKVGDNLLAIREATLEIVVDVENKGNSSQSVQAVTDVYELDAATRKATGSIVATFPSARIDAAGRSKQSVTSSVTLSSPKLWGSPPTQTPHEYIAVTTVSLNGTVVDVYETPFGIRTVGYNADTGVYINGEAVRIQGSCNHHDHGSLGAATNYRAAERQIKMLQEMGNNALRTSHNPPAPEFLDIADRLGLMVIFDTWNYPKVDNDFHRIFPDWHEPDLRAFIRRDRNHPSIISWSVGNELPEQSNSTGGATGKMLQDLVHEEDPTRLVTVAMNSAGSNTSLANAIGIIGLNYQGEGRGNSWSSSFPNFKAAYPNKMIWSTESASTICSRGIYLFPVTGNKSAIVGGSPGDGADLVTHHVSAYELYSPSWSASPDKVFEQQDRHPYVAGEFVWTGWDYIGEPTPYDNSSHLPMAHILPHWTWPEDRVGQVTPVHVFTSGDEAELFVNDVSVGRKKKREYEYRLRWDNVTYTPGSVRVVAYKNGAEWASAERRTAGAATDLNVTADRIDIASDGKELSFITVAVVDKVGTVVPRASDDITFSVASGPGVIVSTDNGDPTDMTPFPSLSRNAFSGLALAIVRTEPGAQGEIVIEAKSGSLVDGKVILKAT